MMCQHHPIAKATAVAALLLATAGPAFAQTTDQDRHQRGEAMIRTLNAGESQATLEGLRREFPFLADAITGYAIGDVWARPVLDHRARQIAAVSAYAALGNRTFMKIHAGYALNLGVSEDDLKEVVSLTTVHAVFPRAIEAAQTLSELFEERRKATGGQP
jgi:4-carboxymuconolactone decarboxylase